MQYVYIQICIQVHIKQYNCHINLSSYKQILHTIINAGCKAYSHLKRHPEAPTATGVTNDCPRFEMSVVESVIWVTTSRLEEGNMGLPPSSVQRILHVNQLLQSGSAAITRYRRPQLPVVLSFTTQCIIFQFYSYLILFFF